MVGLVVEEVSGSSAVVVDVGEAIVDMEEMAIGDGSGDDDDVDDEADPRR